jgi:phosphoenolpyruvate carboxykinase (GTP)
VGQDGRLWGINPESGFFGVAPGTSLKTNPNMIATLKKKEFYPTLYTNTAINADTNEPWWEGLDDPMPKNLIDWQGDAYNPAAGGKAAHPNSRFTVSAYNCPVRSPEYDNPKGVPISAIIFGGRRAQTIPLIAEAENWTKGVFMGARIASETTAAALHQVGVVRRDPFAMLPFCGYHMGDYFGHWLNIGRKLKNPPKIFQVNWFRTDHNGKYIWPGFGENIRVLKWIIERVNQKVNARTTPIGLIPFLEDLDLKGLKIPQERMEKLFEIDPVEWQQEAARIEQYLAQFGDHLPPELKEQCHQLKDHFKD